MTLYKTGRSTDYAGTEERPKPRPGPARSRGEGGPGVSTFYLGQRVTFTEVLRRMQTPFNGGIRRKFWHTFLVPETIGVVVGTRTLSNGESWFEDEAGYVYRPDENAGRVSAVMIATHLRRKPVFAPLEAVKATVVPAK